MILVKDAQNFKGLMKMCKNHRFDKENPRTTLLELEQDTGISKTTIGRIVTEDLKLKKTPAKFIPRFLTNEQKLCRLATCEDMMEMTRTDPEWKDKIITGDETWVYGYDPETKPQLPSGEVRPMNQGVIVAFKRLYKRRQLESCLVFSSDADQPNNSVGEQTFSNLKKYDIKKAIFKFGNSWDELKSSTIRNGWKILLEHKNNSDLETAGDALQLSEDESDEDEQEIRRLEQLFQRARIEVNQESINEWIDIDLDDPGHNVLSNDDIVEAVLSEKMEISSSDDSSSTSEDSLEPDVPRCEALKSLDVALKYLEKRTEPEMLASYNTINSLRTMLMREEEAFLATGDAQGVANFLLEEVILIHGAPREIVTDRGRNFQSKLIQELANCCGIIKRSTTAYHPQTNGLMERLNRTMADMLSMYIDLDQKNWDEILPFVTFAYNTAKQEATGFTPFFLVHGREAETPLDALFPYPETTDSDEYIQELETKAEEARQIARFHILKAQDVNKTNYDSKHRRVTYHPGDLVWIYTPVRRVGLCEKLMRRYFGPYHVTRKLSDVTYECADAFQMLTVAYGEANLDRSNVYRWYKMFSEGREDVNDEERAGRPSTSTTDEKINEVEKMILANRRITVREVAEDLNISIGSCHSIFVNDLGMRRVAAKFVPKLLNCDQKQHRMNIANEMLDSVRDDPNLLQRVITGDEAWVYGYDVKTKAQSSQWKLPHEQRPKKARQVRSNVKVLLTVFFDCRGVVHHEFLLQGRTVNKEYYLQVMRNLREAIRQKRPDLWKNKNWLLHHDNAPAHTSLLVREFLAKNNTLMMPQPPYSPDLAP
ncbi:hypothetical protein LAZ67_13002356, partial [Cordylochernes scorpioides]